MATLQVPTVIVAIATCCGNWTTCLGCLGCLADESNTTQKAPIERQEVPLKMAITLAEKRGQWYVGDRLQALVTIENLSSRDVYFPEWTRPNLENAWRLIEVIDDFPGQFKGAQRLCGSGGSYPPPEMGRPEKVAPRERSAPLSQTCIPQLPGKLTLGAVFQCKFTAVDKKDMKPGDLPYMFPYGWYIDAYLEIPVEATMSPSMANRYEASSQLILDQTRPLADRLAELDKAARERHYFAARLVHEMWQKVENGAVKNAAVNHLISLLEYGTAYQSLADLVKFLADSGAPAESRLRILDAIKNMQIMGDAPGFSIADGQAFYCLSKVVRVTSVGTEARPEFAKTELWQEIVDTLKAVSKDGDAAVAEKAAAILNEKGKGK